MGASRCRQSGLNPETRTKGATFREMAKPKIVLAYSGGLDTTVAVPWLQEKYDADIITLTIDLGMVDLESIRQRALTIGATEALTIDGRDTLVNEFLFPSLQAGTVYEEQYP